MDIFVCVLGYVRLDGEMRNVSRHELDTVRLRCDITGSPLPNYRWYRHGRPLRGRIAPLSSSSSSSAGSAAAAAARIDTRTTPWGSRSTLLAPVSPTTVYLTCLRFTTHLQGCQLSSKIRKRGRVGEIESGV